MPTNKKRPRPAPLPGMENSRIQALDDVAADYADIRDQRMELSTREHDLKVKALKLMHKHGKTIYKHDGIEINVVPGEEDVKVRVKKAADDAEIVTADRAS